MIFFDLDLDRADLQVVVWEANDDQLKHALRTGMDMHLLSARDLYNLPYPDDEIVEGHPKHKEHKARYWKQRDMTKRFIHGTNYFGQARTMAISCGITVAESEKHQKRWFEAHPGIKQWHIRTASELNRHRMVKNRFGYRRFYFDRPDEVLPEALAWVPQSTVACVINRLWTSIDDELPIVQVLAQVHDSLAGQFPVQQAGETIGRLKLLAQKISIPYPEPLIIPCGIKTSQISWGDCS